jgi:hypothetical protein
VALGLDAAIFVHELSAAGARARTSINVPARISPTVARFSPASPR